MAASTFDRELPVTRRHPAFELCSRSSAVRTARDNGSHARDTRDRLHHAQRRVPNKEPADESTGLRDGGYLLARLAAIR